MINQEEELRIAIRELAKQAPQNLDEAGITGWVLDKISNGLKWATNRQADYQYDALLNSKDFRSLASKYGYKSETDFIKRAKDLINKDPKKFANMLAYDYKTQSYGSKGFKI
jgi:hypothetical protein